MPKGAVTISIDLELAWGNWDNLNSGHIHHVEQSERPIVRRLVALFDKYDFPVTWAFVAALLDHMEGTRHAHRKRRRASVPPPRSVPES